MTDAARTDCEAVEEAAAYWLSLQRSGEMSVRQAREFEVWLTRASLHRETFEQMARMWATLGDVHEDPAVLASSERDAKRFDWRKQATRAGAIAAVAVLAVFGGQALMNSSVMGAVEQLVSPPTQELRTSVGQRTTYTMRDHSIVTLDTDSIVRIRETLRERRVELVQGRAFFEVAKDKNRPFLVAAAGRTVRATGTAFDVRVDQGLFQVILVEGRVRVQDSSQPKGEPQVADMRAGWRLIVDKENDWRINPVNIAQETSWRRGRLTFLREPLTNAVAEMNRYSERRLVLRGDVEEAYVVGVFRAGDVESFAEAAEMNKLARVAERDDRKIVLVPR